MAAIFSSNRQNINKWWWFLLAFFAAFVVGVHGPRHLKGHNSEQGQWSLKKRKSTTTTAILSSKSKREKNSKGRSLGDSSYSSSSSVKAFFWLWRERWGQMHIDDICGPLTNSNSSSLFVRRSQPHSSSNSTYYNNCSTHKSIVLSEARSRSNYPWWRLPSAMICVLPEWPRFFQKRSAFLFTQISEMMPIANLWQFHEQIG